MAKKRSQGTTKAGKQARRERGIKAIRWGVLGAGVLIVGVVLVWGLL